MARDGQVVIQRTVMNYNQQRQKSERYSKTSSVGDTIKIKSEKSKKNTGNEIENEEYEKTEEEQFSNAVFGI